MLFHYLMSAQGKDVEVSTDVRKVFLHWRQSGASSLETEDRERTCVSWCQFYLLMLIFSVTCLKHLQTTTHIISSWECVTWGPFESIPVLDLLAHMHPQDRGGNKTKSDLSRSWRDPCRPSTACCLTGVIYCWWEGSPCSILCGTPGVIGCTAISSYLEVQSWQLDFQLPWLNFQTYFKWHSCGLNEEHTAAHGH